MAGKTKEKMSLKEFRFTNDLSQNDLGEKIGYSRERIAQVEDDGKVSEKMLFKLKQAFPGIEDQVQFHVVGE